MINEQIVGYVAGERARGVTDEGIRGALLAQGWRADDITASMYGLTFTATNSPKEFSLGNLFEGRLGRWQFFFACLVLVFLCTCIGILYWLAEEILGNEALFITTPLATLLYVAAIPFGLGLSIRRAHDLNWSGWCILLTFIPVVGFVFALVLFFKNGTEGNNTYGAPQANRGLLKTILNT